MTGLARHRFRSALVAGQIALALILLAGAGLMINSFFRLTGADLGCNPSGVHHVRLRFPGIAIRQAHRLLQQLSFGGCQSDSGAEFRSAIPANSRTAGSAIGGGQRVPPMQGGEDKMTFTIQGQPLPQSDAQRNAMSAVYYPVTPGMFATLHSPLLRGRDFTDRDPLRRPGWRSSIRPWLAPTGRTKIRSVSM